MKYNIELSNDRILRELPSCETVFGLIEQRATECFWNGATSELRRKVLGSARLTFSVPFERLTIWEKLQFADYCGTI